MAEAYCTHTEENLRMTHTRVFRGILQMIAVVGVLVGSAAALPPNFQDIPVPGTWNQAVGLTFAPDGRMFVWEKGGRVWNVENNQQAAQPLIDIAEEVGNWRDHGMLGFAIDPQFYTNGYIYLLYVVDYQHLIFYGTPSYNPSANWYFRDTIIRLTRYQCDSATGFRTVLPNSRTVLIGESITTGIPVCHQSHSAGTLVFGHDGSLLVSCGEGANYETFDHGGPASGSSNTALADGIITQTEDVGAWRSQLVNSLSGKILRVNPANGDGLPDNPFYDSNNPRAPRSRVWALGLRNPFRMALRPVSGHGHRHHDGPGTLYIGDVGWGWWEEINVCNAPGQNFGWPHFEGMEPRGGYANAQVFNRDAPNPLFGIGACTQQFLTFSSLIAQETLGTPSFPNPCNINMQIPPSTPTFMHSRPKIDWYHSSGPSRTGIFNGNNAAVINIGAPGSPVAGEQFGGFTSIGGAWYTGHDFPPEYRDVYFHADFVSGWIRAFVFDEQDNPVEVREFMGQAEAGAVVDIESHPAVEGLFFIRYNEVGQSQIRRVIYLGGTNQPPVAVGSALPPYGPSPLTVQFSSAGSLDPEGMPLTYRWDFGDGSPVSTLPNPVHIYDEVEDITAGGTIIARVFELVPPHPTGGGNWNAEIIRDADFPPVGNQDSQRQYDTYHGGQQGNFDYVGYTFPTTRRISGLVFQEGKHFGDGGWWDTVQYQYRNPNTGNWAPIPGVIVTPAYPGNNGTSFETFSISFPPIDATGVRLAGDPGGSANFVSFGELRVMGVLVPAGTPRRFDATLTVCDHLNVCTTATVPIWTDNTPPNVQITSPIDGTYYNANATFTQNLQATISDAEHATGTLQCQWYTILHHNDHTHPEPPDTSCQTAALITPHGESEDVFFWEFVLTVSDPLGLSRTERSIITPPPLRCPGDADFDGVVGFADITTILAQWASVGPYGDTDDNGIVNFSDATLTLANWGNSCP